MSSFEATKSVFNITNENNSFSIIIRGHWGSKSDERSIDELNKLLEPKSEKSNELHVKEFRKRWAQIKRGNVEKKLSDFDTQNKTRFLEI